MKHVLLRLDLGIAGMGIKTHDTTTVSAIQNVHMHQLLTRFNIISDFESSIKLSDSFFFFFFYHLVKPTIFCFDISTIP